VDKTKPFAMPADGTRITVQCDDCVAEKNAPGGSGWAPGEGHENVDFSIELPLEEEFAIVTCPRGHEHGVVRLGTERAANFGYA
jgi:hypothetical protein